MKRVCALLTAVLLINVAAFSDNFFTKRFFEVKAGLDLSVANNALSATDVLKKELVLDLRKLADDCPASGYNVTAGVNTSLAMNINIVKFHLGFSTGVETYEKLEIGKGIFDFLGYGNTMGQTITTNINNNAEIFAFSQLDIGLDLKRFNIHVKPAIFAPVAIVKNSGGTATARNTADGKILIDALLDTEVYTPLGVTMENGQIKINPNSIGANMFTGFGFDVAGSIRIPLSKSFGIEAEARIPLIPGRIKTKYRVGSQFSMETSLFQLGNTQPNFTNPTVSGPIETNLAVNRPLKAAAYLDKNLIGKLFNIHLGGGVGIRNAFTDGAVFYPEYYLGLTLNIFDVFKLGVSSAYRDQVFIHQLGTTLNIRFIQLDVGGSLQSSNFKKSFTGAGAGAYVYVTVGF